MSVATPFDASTALVQKETKERNGSIFKGPWSIIEDFVNSKHFSEKKRYLKRNVSGSNPDTSSYHPIESHVYSACIPKTCIQAAKIYRK